MPTKEMISPEHAIFAIWSKDTATHRSYQIRDGGIEGTIWIPKDQQPILQANLIFAHQGSDTWKSLDHIYKVKDRAGDGPKSQRDAKDKKK